MKPAYDLYSLFTGGMPAEGAVRVTDAVLGQHGAALNDDCVLILADFGDETPPPNVIADAETALAQLAGWPALGSIEYHLGDVSVLATFHAMEASKGTRVSCIQLSVSSDWFDRLRPMSEEKFGSIANELHSTATADRTVMSWRGRPPDISWAEEIERLQAGVVEGEYDVDLRRAMGGQQ